MIRGGHAETTSPCSGDHLDREDYRDLNRNYNRVTAMPWAPLNYGGPNAFLRPADAAGWTPYPAVRAILVAQRLGGPQPLAVCIR